MGRMPLHSQIMCEVSRPICAKQPTFAFILRIESRDADFTVVTTGDVPSGVFAKFANLVIWAEISPAQAALWVSTQISETSGTLSANGQELRDRDIGSFLIGRSNMRKAAKKKLFSEMSHPQKVKLDRWKLENAGRIANSALFEAMLADVPVIEAVPPTSKIGRNAPCPCGSGRKFKRCHGG